MRHHKTLNLLTAALATTAITCSTGWLTETHAQDTPAKTQAQPARPDRAQPDRTQPAPNQPDRAQPDRAQNDRDDKDKKHDEAVFESASRMMDKTIYGSDREELATISDLIIDHANGRAEYVVINIDRGVLDVGGTDYAVPYGILRWDHTNDRLMMNATAKDFEGAPTFNASRWASLEERDIFNDVQEYFGYESEDNKPKPSLFLASDLQGADIRSAGDKDIGDASMLVFECRSGKLVALIVEPDVEDVDIDEDKVVPFSSVSGIKDGDMMVNFDGAKLAQAHDAPDEVRSLKAEDLKKALGVFNEEVPEFKPVENPDWKPGDKTNPGNRAGERE